MLICPPFQRQNTAVQVDTALTVLSISTPGIIGVRCDGIQVIILIQFLDESLIHALERNPHTFSLRAKPHPKTTPTLVHTNRPPLTFRHTHTWTQVDWHRQTCIVRKTSTNTHTDNQTHTHNSKCFYTHPQLCWHPQTHTHTHTHSHRHTHRHTRTHTRSNKHACTHIHEQTTNRSK